MNRGRRDDDLIILCDGNDAIVAAVDCATPRRRQGS
jgi:hypothetical protein